MNNIQKKQLYLAMDLIKNVLESASEPDAPAAKAERVSKFVPKIPVKPFKKRPTTHGKPRKKPKGTVTDKTQRNYREPWTKKDDKLLWDTHTTSTIDELSKLFGRSKPSISGRLTVLREQHASAA